MLYHYEWAAFALLVAHLCFVITNMFTPICFVLASGKIDTLFFLYKLADILPAVALAVTTTSSHCSY